MTEGPRPRVLMVAYHFPPLAGSSGIQRTLRFVQHLPRFGWQPLVLTTCERAYVHTSPDQLRDIPPGAVVRRAFALDAARHLAIGGRYIGATARPDRWASWKLDGVRQGLKMVREFSPQAIWSTYPIATAHLIGGELARRSGLPWVADFRDPMVQTDYPTDRTMREQFRRIESDVVRRASLTVFTSPSAADECRQRHPEAADKIMVLENGYDEETFNQAAQFEMKGPLNPGCITLLHSGIVYASERDPSQLMQALRKLHDAKIISAGEFRVRFRASLADGLLQQLANRHGVGPYIEIMPAIPYRDALAEMLQAEALLILQATNCNQQVPAKLYEYLRSGRPIVCLSDPAGDTCRKLASMGILETAPLTDADHVAALLKQVLGRCRSGIWDGFVATSQAIAAESRRFRTAQLARWLDQTTQKHPSTLRHT